MQNHANNNNNHTDSLIHAARKLYRATTASMVADTIACIQKIVEEAVMEQSRQGKIHIKLDIKEDLVIDQVPENMALIITQFVIDMLETDGCELTPGAITATVFGAIGAKKYTVTVRGNFNLIDPDEINVPTSDGDLLQDIKKIIKDRKRKRVDEGEEDDEGDEKKKARKE
jgi:hypothetical protein